MRRYFLEVSYKGTRYSGFQAQPNAVTIQSEIEKALNTLFSSGRMSEVETGRVQLVCSSRTDAGVHANQNFFHFDWSVEFDRKKIYNLNALLPADIVIKSIKEVAYDANSRFDAISRTYNYRIYNSKNPFLTDIAYFYPYPLDLKKLNEAAEILKSHTNFTSFSKRNTQVKTFNCNILESHWFQKDDVLVYEVKANRFLRGMVRALTATMLKVGRGKLGVDDFKTIIESRDCTKAFFDTPAHGLFLMEVLY